MSTNSVSERQVNVDGRPVRVIERGTGPTAVVLLHGGLAGHGSWQGSADLWLPVLQRLEFARVVAIDLPGAGGTPASTLHELTIAGLTSHVAATLEALDITTAIPVGHGEASLIALALARNSSSERLSIPGALVVAAIGAAPTSDGVPPIVLSEPPVQQSAQTQIRWALDHLSWSVPHLSCDIVSKLAEHASGPGRRSAAELIAAPGASERLDADLLASKLELFAFARDTGYDTPVAIVWGADDPLLTIEHGDALFALLSTTRAELSFSLVPRSGHLVFREEPDAFVRTLAPFAVRMTAAPAAGALA